jgi:hypothetical protein
LVGVESNTDTKAVELGRILQSLDEDGDPTNGIDLTKKSEELAKADISIDLTQSQTIDADNVINQIANYVEVKKVVTAEEAKTHLEAVDNKVKEAQAAAEPATGTTPNQGGTTTGNDAPPPPPSDNATGDTTDSTENASGDTTTGNDAPPPPPSN